MSLIFLYPALKIVHLCTVALSGSLFVFRGLCVLSGVLQRHRLRLNRLSYLIDTVLLASAVGLLVVLSMNPLKTPWLMVKLVLLLVYIVLGSLALKRARSPRRRLLAFVAAVVCFLLMIGIARAHSPWGWLALI